VLPHSLGNRPESSRFVLLIKKLSLQYWRTPGAYFYRLIAIILFGFFAGSLYTDLKPKTESLTEITGCIFFSLFLLALPHDGQHSGDTPHPPPRELALHHAVNNYASGRHSFGTYCIAQFVAALPWQLMCATTFTTLIYWIPFYNWTISGGGGGGGTKPQTKTAIVFLNNATTPPI
jgi:hypothetical protein